MALRASAAWAALFALLLGAPLAASPGSLGAIALADQTGRTFRLDDLRGAPVVLTFTATRCADACPIANGLFARLRDRPHEQRTRVALVSVTLDPAYDTPFVLARAARAFAARPPGWRFAGGAPQNVARLMAGLGVVAQRDNQGVPDVHSSFVYVFDARGQLRKTIPLSTNVVADVVAALGAR